MVSAEQRQSGLSLAMSVGLETAGNTVGCSITSRRDDGSMFTPAASGDLAVDLNAVQYAAGEGPCLTAISQQRPQLIDAVAAEARWPAFTASAGAVGVRSSLSVPMPETSSPAGLNLYCAVEGGYRSARAQALAKLLAAAAAAFLGGRSASQEGVAEGVTAQQEQAIADRAAVLRQAQEWSWRGTG